MIKSKFYWPSVAKEPERASEIAVGHPRFFGSIPNAAKKAQRKKKMDPSRVLLLDDLPSDGHKSTVIRRRYQQTRVTKLFFFFSKNQTQPSRLAFFCRTKRNEAHSSSSMLMKPSVSYIPSFNDRAIVSLESSASKKNKTLPAAGAFAFVPILLLNIERCD